MKVLVCGGRNYRWRSTVFNILDKFDAKHKISLLITGAAKGTDSLAQEWANSRQIPYVGHPAKWQKNGKKAGPIRNSEMLEVWEPDCGIAFPGGDGTADMVKKLRSAGLNVWEIEDKED